MKSSYRIIGSYLDHVPECAELTMTASAPAEAAPVFSNETLFDCFTCMRSVLLSELLSCTDENAFERYLNALACAEEILILMDYEPSSENSLLRKFFEHRMRQIIWKIENFTSARVYIAKSAEVNKIADRPIRTIMQLLQKADALITDLEENGHCFNEEGFPIIPRRYFVNKTPRLLVDYYHRNGSLVVDSSSTVIVFFRDDDHILRRIRYLDRDIPEYARFMAVAETDLTVTRDMDIEFQEFIMLLNRLCMAYLASRGVKVVPSTRCGSTSTLRLLRSVPKDVVWVSSALGCDSLHRIEDMSFISKILAVMPSTLLLYGKSDELALNQLKTMGIEYATYEDVHSASKSRRNVDAHSSSL